NKSVISFITCSSIRDTDIGINRVRGLHHHNKFPTSSITTTNPQHEDSAADSGFLWTLQFTFSHTCPYALPYHPSAKLCGILLLTLIIKSLNALKVTSFSLFERLFSANCSDISIALAKQIQAFGPEMGCAMCLYNLVSITPQYIMANHTSPDGLTTEKISISFLPTMLPDGCRVSAVSQSSLFSPSLLDNGVNYCNLHDLVAASGLASQPDFMEMTNEWACLSYGLATCSM
uniref:Uncharacterized protein n=1 Tax=Neogobius melanostomus TaxID=47308 RepID=A0A8C6UP74_9GOBI